MVRAGSIGAVVGACLLVGLAGCAQGTIYSDVIPEQRSLSLREPEQLPAANIGELPPPATVTDPQPEARECFLTLDEAIRIALAHSRVVRVLTGVSATTSGRTIYDAAITNTTIDQQRARFDPTLQVNNTWARQDQPQAFFNPLSAAGVGIAGFPSDSYTLNTQLTKTTVTGGTMSFGFTDTLTRFPTGPSLASASSTTSNFFNLLNPENQTSLSFGYTQPLLQGASIAANLAPIVIARINTERSYFQLKDSLQEEVRGVVEAYWALVFARTDVWAREQQVKQGKEQYDRAAARAQVHLANAAEVAQTKLTLANFTANLVTAKANELQREAALRNILGLPPSDGKRLVPVSIPTRDRKAFHWPELVRLAEERRPDLIELKLIIEADEQALIQARNQALPKLDAQFLYQWNGLEGTTPSGATVAGGPLPAWTMGVNFSVPLGLRKERAVLRQQQLILVRDEANLNQGLHAAAHDLADTVRTLAERYEEYRSFSEAREAARANLDQQLALYGTGKIIFLNVAQAIADWGNAVSAEAQALTQYNTVLANVERQTGTILETHGVHFFEERFDAIGPLGRLAHPRPYPQDTAPTPNADRYPNGTQPSENIFDLKVPRFNPEQLPTPNPLPPTATPPRATLMLPLSTTDSQK